MTDCPAGKVESRSHTQWTGCAGLQSAASHASIPSRKTPLQRRDCGTRLPCLSVTRSLLFTLTRGVHSPAGAELQVARRERETGVRGGNVLENVFSTCTPLFCFLSSVCLPCPCLPVCLSSHPVCLSFSHLLPRTTLLADRLLSFALAALTSGDEDAVCQTQERGGRRLLLVYSRFSQAG